MDWRRKWQPIPVFLPGKFHGQRSLVGYSTLGCRVRHNWTHTHTMPPPLSTFLPDQTLGLCRDYFWNLILRFLRSALEVLVVPAWEPRCLCSQPSPGRAQGSSRWPCTRFAPGLAPMWLLRLLHVTFSVEVTSALPLSWGSPLWKRSLGIAELCWSLQKQDAFSPEVCGSQLPNEAYLIKELVPIEFSKKNK